MLYEKDNYLLRQCKIKKEELLRGEIIVFTIQKDRYYEEKLAKVLSKCKNCGRQHIESCPVNQERVKIEKDYLGENVPYLGSVIKYLESLKYMNVNLYEKVHNSYKKNTH